MSVPQAAIPSHNHEALRKYLNYGHDGHAVLASQVPRSLLKKSFYGSKAFAATR